MNVWILTGIRSGSTLLWKMLWDTGMFTFPEKHSEHPSLDPQRAVGEYLAPNHAVDPWDALQVPRTREMALQYLKMKSRSAGPGPNLLKLPMEQYNYYMLDHADRPIVEELFPDSKFIWLEREDIFARTISAYIFFTTKIAHLHSERAKQEWLKKPVPWDPKGVLDVYYNHVKKCDWYPFLDGAPHLKVGYEELVAEPAATLRRCADWLDLRGRNGIDFAAIAAKQPKIKTERPETEEYIRKLKRLLAGMI